MMTLTTSIGHSENWKKYYENDDNICYYDKDSIHYPKQKKSIFGLTVRDKEIVNVWTRSKYKESGKTGYSHLTIIYCATRYFDSRSPDSRSIDGPINLLDDFMHGPIKPGSIEESLLEKVCP
jgi:hypothetical protein